VTLWGDTGQCHKMSKGGGRGFAKVSRDIFFLQNSESYLYILKLFRALFSKKTSRRIAMSQNDTRESLIKNNKKDRILFESTFYQCECYNVLMF
jgi:hypothetical protein